MPDANHRMKGASKHYGTTRFIVHPLHLILAQLDRQVSGAFFVWEIFGNLQVVKKRVKPPTVSLTGWPLTTA